MQALSFDRRWIAITDEFDMKRKISDNYEPYKKCVNDTDVLCQKNTLKIIFFESIFAFRVA